MHAFKSLRCSMHLANSRIPHLVIILLQERMFDAIFFVCNDRRKIYIFNTLKNITFHIWIHLFQSFDQFLDLNTFGLIFLIITSCTP